MAKAKAKAKSNPGASQTAQANAINQGILDSAQGWDQFAHSNAQGSIDYAQGNPFTGMAQDSIQHLLSGDMSSNPFMSDLYSNLHGQSPNDIMGWLTQYIGAAGEGGGHNPGGQATHGIRSVGGSYAAGEAAARQAGQRGGQNGANYVPDTITGSNSFFAQQTRDMFDPSHLDPANDPTLQPTIDAIQREAGQDYLGNAAALQMQAEAGGRYGSGLYQAMEGQQAEQQHEAISQAIAQELMGAYQAQRNRQSAQLGLVNQRDLGAMNDMTQRAAIDAQAGAASAAAASAERQAAAERQLQAAGMLLNSQMGMLGMKGDMASLMQTGQLGALNAGLGYGQLGMSGYQAAAGMGALGMNALGMQGNVANSYLQQGQAAQQYALEQQQLEAQRQQQQWQNQMYGLQQQQSSVNDYLQLLMGIGSMGGSSYQTSPGQYIPSMDPGAAALMGGLGGYLQGYGATQQGGGH